MKLMHGDCLDLMQTIPDGSVDMVMCDPPYGTTACDWDSVIPLEPMWEQLRRVIKANGAIVLMAGQPFTSALIMSNPSMFKYCWVWKKSRVTGFLNARKQPLRMVEDVVVFYGEQCRYNPQGVRECSKEWSSGNNASGENSDNYGRINGMKYTKTQEGYPTQILDTGSVARTKHPTQKPVALMEYLIRTYTNESETVLDFTMGSGTTGVACQNAGRDFIGIEKDDKYFAMAKKRIEGHHPLFRAAERKSESKNRTLFDEDKE